MFPTVTFYKVSTTLQWEYWPLRTAELSRRPDNYRKFKVTLIIFSEENRLLNIHTHDGAPRECNLCEDRATDELDCGIVLFEKLKLFFAPYFFLFPIQVQPNRENTVNIKSIINIYNLHILKILSITKMWEISSQQLVGPDVICMPQKASACHPRFVFDFACLLVLSTD